MNLSRKRIYGGERYNVLQHTNDINQMFIEIVTYIDEYGTSLLCSDTVSDSELYENRRKHISNTNVNRVNNNNFNFKRNENNLIMDDHEFVDDDNYIHGDINDPMSIKDEYSDNEIQEQNIND